MDIQRNEIVVVACVAVKFILLIFFAIFIFCSCATTKSSVSPKANFSEGTAYDKTNSLRTSLNGDDRNKYILGVEDIVSVLYFEDYSKSGTSYRLKVRDEIEVTSSSHPDLNSKLKVRPDGKVSLKRIGDLMIAGSTPTEVAGLLKKKFSKTLRNPEIAVNVTTFHTALDQLFKSLEAFESKQRITATIRADGYITLPMIGDIKADGLTVEALNNEITKKYATQSIPVLTNAILTKAGSRQVLVLGEVQKPGLYPMPRYLSALQAVTLAGGYKDSAALKKVFLIRKGNDNRPYPITADLGEVLSSGDMNKDVPLEPYDVVYVPKTDLDRITTVFQRIYKLLPPNLTLGFVYILNSDNRD